MARTVIPTKTIQTIDAGPFRANLRRWEHFLGQTPIFSIDTWDNYRLVSRSELLGEEEALSHWATMESELAVMVAKRAFGITKSPPYDAFTLPS